MKRILMFAISISVLVFGFSAPAQAAPKSIKLTKAQFKNVGPYQCGLVKGAWVPGINTKSTKKVRYFIPFTAYAADETKKAKKVKGKSKSAVKKRAAFEKKAANFTERANQQASTCASGVYATPGFTPANMNQAPIRINISNSNGLAKASGPVGSFSKSNARSFTGEPGVTSPRFVTSGDSLVSVMSNGSLRDSITSGTISIQNFIVADNGKAYISTSGVSLDGRWDSERCVLIEVTQSSDVPTCVQGNPYTWTSSNFNMQWYGSSQNNSNPSVQTDASGAVYYSGQANGSAVLRKYSNGVRTDIISDNIWINDFVVLPNGNVVVQGSTPSTGTAWVKLFYANGGLRSIEPSTYSNFLRMFSDGNIYYAANGEIRVFDTQTLARRANSWFGGSSPSHVAVTVCPTYGCSGLSSPRKIVKLSDHSAYALIQSGGSNAYGVAKIYPSVAEVLPGAVIDAKIIGSAGTKLAIAGLDSSGFQTLEIFDPSTSTYVTLLNSTNEIEIGAMSFRSTGNQLVFSGLRFSDNRTVVGTVDLNTNTVSFGVATTSKLYDLQAFG